MIDQQLEPTRLSLLRVIQGMIPCDDQTLERARGEFCALYGTLILGRCLECGLQQADAEDVTQELLLKLFVKVRLYQREKGRFRPWLRTVVRNAVTDVLRRRQRYQPLTAAAGLANLPDELSGVWAPQFVPELAAEIVRQVKSRVQPHTWDAFYRVVVLEEDRAQVAQDLGLSRLSVKVAVHRIGKMLSELGKSLRESDLQ